MNLRQIEHFLAVAETRSFSRAAVQTHLTQSALSRSIQTLEDDLGARLFDRIGKKVELTPVGLTVVARARRLVLEAGELRRAVDFAQSADVGSIRVGLGSGPGAVLMTPFLTYMARQHPKVQVSIARGASDLQVAQLRARTLDALVVDARSMPPDADLSTETISEMRAGFIVRRGHPLLATRGRTTRTPVTIEQILAYPLACTPLSTEIRQRIIDRYGAAANPDQAVTLRCEDVTSLIDTVRQSDAVFLGIVGAARQYTASGEVVELNTQPTPAMSAKFALVTLAGRSEPPAMAILRAFVRERLRDTDYVPGKID